jgi:hypothetical protein
MAERWILEGEPDTRYTRDGRQSVWWAGRADTSLCSFLCYKKWLGEMCIEPGCTNTDMVHTMVQNPRQIDPVTGLFMMERYSPMQFCKEHAVIWEDINNVITFRYP